MEKVLTSPCKGMNCGCADGVSHSLECHAEHAAAIAGGYFVKVAQHRAALEECVEALEESWRTEKGDAAILLAQKTLRKESMHAPDVCKKDAERYRWLASQAFVNLSEWCHTYHLAQKAGGLTPYVDAAITQANEVLGRKEGGV